MTFLGHASFLTSLKKREFLKPEIAKPYQSVCNKSNVITTFLFGDELPKHIKEIGEVNKISKMVSGRPNAFKNTVNTYKSGADGRTYQQRSGGRRTTFFRLPRSWRTFPGQASDKTLFHREQHKNFKRQSIGEVCPLPLTQAGNLLINLHKWREITSDPWILVTVSGYHLEFESLPYQSKPPKLPTFSARETELIEVEINKLISKGAISEVHPCRDEFISNLFLVNKKTDDFRPVINLKPLNQLVQKIHFKMENIRMALNSISPGDYMVSVDLKDAYFSVPIFQPHRKYLRFLWSSRRFEFSCLPFGYSLAPRVFTKIFKPVMAYFRFLGFRVFIFIDDILLVASSYQECLDQLSIIKQTLQGLGFIVNVEKSQLIPVTEIHYLGFIINSILMKLQLPEGKLEKIISACTQLLAKAERPVLGMWPELPGFLSLRFQQ